MFSAMLQIFYSSPDGIWRVELQNSGDSEMILMPWWRSAYLGLKLNIEELRLQNMAQKSLFCAIAERSSKFSRVHDGWTGDMCVESVLRKWKKSKCRWLCLCLLFTVNAASKILAGLILKCRIFRFKNAFGFVQAVLFCNNSSTFYAFILVSTTAVENSDKFKPSGPITHRINLNPGDWLQQNHTNSHFFLDLGTKSIDCRYHMTGEVSMADGSGLLQSTPSIQYRYPALIISKIKKRTVLLPSQPYQKDINGSCKLDIQ